MFIRCRAFRTAVNNASFKSAFRGYQMPMGKCTPGTLGIGAAFWQRRSYRQRRCSAIARRLNSRSFSMRRGQVPPGELASYDPQKLAQLRATVDAAWKTLRLDERAYVTKLELAELILQRAAQGESDPISLTTFAVEAVRRRAASAKQLWRT